MISRAKALYPLGFLFAASSAFACPHTRTQYLCPGSSVIDSSGNTATVAGVNPRDGSVALRYSYSTSTGVSTSRVSIKEGCMDDVCVGDKVIDSNGNTATISGLNLYEHTYALQYSYSTSVGVRGDRIYVDGCATGVCTDDTVIDSNGNTAKIGGVNLYTGTYAVRYSYSTSTGVKLSSLSLTNYCTAYGAQHPYRRERLRNLPDGSKWDYRTQRRPRPTMPVGPAIDPMPRPANPNGGTIGCRHSRDQFLCPGSAVIDSNGNAATVSAVNPTNGTVAVRYSYSTSTGVSPSKLYLKEGCLAVHCVGDAVIDTNGNTAKIAGVNPYSNTYAVQYSYSTSTGVSAERLYVTDGCVYGVCAGDTVIDSNGNTAKIGGVNYYTGNVAVRYSYSTSTGVDIGRLSLTNYCTQYGADHPYRADRPRSAPRSGEWIWVSVRG